MSDELMALADELAPFIEQMDMIIAMRECADTSTTYSGKTHDLGCLVADHRSTLRKILAALRAQGEM